MVKKINWRRLAVRATMVALCCAFSIISYAEEFMSVSEVQPGMTGYAKTVTHVGKVESISTTKYGVDAKIKLDKGTEIPKDSKVIVATDGLLGEKIIQITPGEDSNHLLTNGDYIYGTAGQSMDDMQIFLMKMRLSLLDRQRLILREGLFKAADRILGKAAITM